MKASVLIVDDEKVICDGLERLLSGEYTVYKALNGSLALEVLREHSGIDVILCDIMMPVMDGIELIEKARSVRKDVIIIAITGLYSGEKICEAIEKGADRYLLKPLDISQLESTIKNLLENRSALKGNVSSR